ncbi:asparaginase [Pseudonocardia sp. GCM10023141]|uniref:asparaginase n=1 Tax=Pseudonocardia sp. GCM10023141 TaxID=3252653 RepID=UPI003607D12A
MQRVVVLATGGTIASRGAGVGGAVAEVPGEQLLASIDPPVGVRLEVEQFLQVNSFNLTIAQLAQCAARTRELLADPAVRGVVITHGTDTMEETGLFLDLFLDSGKPVVLTGAQRTADAEDGDGARNLQDAITVAADVGAAGLGVVIVFDGRVWAAPGTRKTQTLASAAFSAPAGPLGTIVAGGVRVERRPVHPSRFDLDRFAADDVRVDIVAAYPGVDTVALDAVVAAKCRGVVVEGTGVGNAGQRLTTALVALLRDGMPVVLSTRVADGPTAAIYGGGGGADLVAAGALLGGTYRAPQLRILLIAALGTTDSDDAARLAVAAHLAHASMNGR